MLSTSTVPSSCAPSLPVSRASYFSKPLRKVVTPLWVTAKAMEEWTVFRLTGPALEALAGRAG